jgi:hypothetical protein
MTNEFESFYLSDPDNVPKALELTGLALDELEGIVGYFTKTSHRAGQMRGEVVCGWDGVLIRHHFTKKVLWRAE